MRSSGRVTTVVGLGAVLCLALLVVLKFYRDSQTNTSTPRPARTSNKEASSEDVPVGPDKASIRPSTVNVLSRVDPSRDAVKGDWKFQDGALVTPKTPWARLQLPFKPPSEYDVTLRVVKEDGNDSLNLGLSQNGRQFMVVLEGNGATASGLDLIQGKGFSQNETTFKFPVFILNRPTTIFVSVRKNKLTVTVDDNAVIQWRGDYGVLATLSNWTIYDNSALFIGSWATTYRILEISVSPVAENEDLPGER